MCTVTSLLPFKTLSLVISNCRRNKVTFGNVLPVISQVALVRVLYRLRPRGDIRD